jgi:anthranilate phosphoribosyltransferase
MKKTFNKDEIKNMMETFNLNQILKNKAYQNKALSFEEGYLLGITTIHAYKNTFDKVITLDKSIAEKQSLATLCALHNQETYRHNLASNQIAGITASILDYDIGESKNGFLEMNLDYVMDNCGMGGDLFKTPNVSTIAGIIAASEGIPFCKHGSPGNTDSVGSSDFLKYLGVNLFADKEKVIKGILEINFGYTDALDQNYKKIHLHSQRAQIAHMNDIIGPMTNPLSSKLTKKKIIGINHLIEPKVIAEAYKILNEKGVTNLEHGLFIRGFIDENKIYGMDEASTLPGGTKVAELKNGEIKEYQLFAKDFGLPEGDYNNIKPPYSKKEFSKNILENKIQGDVQNLILANTALIFYVAKDIPLKEGVNIARKSLYEGKPMQTIQKYINIVGDEK